MRTIQIPTPLTWFYPDRLWRSSESSRNVSLTFDDGPVPGVTDWVVGELEKRGMQATFFMVGDNVRKHPGLAAEVLSAGHQLGNHTYHHLSGWKTSKEEYLNDIASCDEVIASTLGLQPIFFRPPYGLMKPSQAKEVAKIKKIVMWSLLSYDFDGNAAADKLIQACTSRTSPGSILVFHDQEKTKVQLKKILPIYLDFLVEEGFTTQLLEH